MAKVVCDHGKKRAQKSKRPKDRVLTEGVPETGSDMPTRIDRYELLRKLATGGMAELFLAKQGGLEGFEKVVVLKRILSNLAADDDFVSMFLDEARIAAKLSHPNIVQIYDLGKSQNSFYIAMEYVSGRNVQHLIEKEESFDRKIPVEHVCRIAAGVCDGLYYAHTRKDYDGTALNIVHRDVSPQNILVSFAGGVKLVDFGIAKASTQLAQTRAGVLKGKYAYMSPEQVRGAKIDHRADIFAVGLVMYEMLTGTRAFERESSLKTLKAIVQDKPLNPRELNPDVPMEVVKLLSRALEKKPERRYKNAQEMQLAIEDYLDRSPKKSNNIRLSRYLYDLFDDELNSDSGTLIVKGIGEVIVPTGQEEHPRKPRVEEEVDSKTLSAALMPTNDSKSDEAPTLAAAAAGGADRWTSAPTTRHSISNPEDSSSLGDSGSGDDEIESDNDDEDDKTIPAFSMEEYERERAVRKTANEETGTTSEVDTEFDEDVKTVAGLSRSTVDIIESNPDDGNSKVSLTSVEESESTIALVGQDHPSDLVQRLRESEEISANTEEIHPNEVLENAAAKSEENWDGATASEQSINSGTEQESLLPSLAELNSDAQSPISEEIVPGLPSPASAGEVLTVRPPAASRSLPSNQAPTQTPSLPLHPTPETNSMAASNSGALNDGTTAKTRETSLPLIYIAAAVGIVGCIFGAFFLLGIWFFFIDVDKPEPVDEKIAVQIMASCDCSLTVDGKKEDSVNSVVYLKAGKHKIILTKNGKAYATRDVSLNTTKNFYLVQF